MYRVKMTKQNIKYYLIIHIIYLKIEEVVIYIYENENDPEKVDDFKFYLLFGIVDDTNNIYDNLQATDNTQLKDNYANSITSSKTNYKLTLLYETQVFRRRTAAIMYINIPDDAELQDEITFSYNNKQFMTLKYGHQDQKNTIIARAKWDGQTISIIHKFDSKVNYQYFIGIFIILDLFEYKH